MHKSGREEKKVQASAAGAITTLAWNHDGTALATGGEDGMVKVWSRTGMLRSNLVTAAKPVYGLRWSPDGDQLLYASGRELFVRSVAGDRKVLSWKAHDGVVLSVDWSPVHSLIVTGGEDLRYRVWDSFGRQLFVSSPLEYAVTSVAWSPRGDAFAVGAFGILRLCDRHGWSYSRESHDAGSLMSLSWTTDGTQVAGGGAGGSVTFAQILGKRVSAGGLTCELVEPRSVTVLDGTDGTSETLDFRDRVSHLSLGFGFFVVTTATQCHLYNTEARNWHAPHVFDLRAPVSLVLQSERHFLLVDAASGIQVFSYEGRLLCNPKYAGMRVESLDAATLSLGPDCVAVLDKADGKSTCGGNHGRDDRALTSSLSPPSRDVPPSSIHPSVPCLPFLPFLPFLSFPFPLQRFVCSRCGTGAPSGRRTHTRRRSGLWPCPSSRPACRSAASRCWTRTTTCTSRPSSSTSRRSC